MTSWRHIRKWLFTLNRPCTEQRKDSIQVQRGKQFPVGVTSSCTCNSKGSFLPRSPIPTWVTAHENYASSEIPLPLPDLAIPALSWLLSWLGLQVEIRYGLLQRLPRGRCESHTGRKRGTLGKSETHMAKNPNEITF